MIKNLAISVIITIFLGFIIFLTSPALACHIINVDPEIDCDGYKVTIWASVTAGYTLNMDITLINNYTGYFEEFHHSKTFNKSSSSIKTVFSGSWGDIPCMDYNYNFTGNVELRNQCNELADSESGQRTLRCECSDE